MQGSNQRGGGDAIWKNKRNAGKKWEKGRGKGMEKEKNNYTIVALPSIFYIL